jgi:hypothetical protein
MGLRPTEEEEMEGMDIQECGMEAYPEFDQNNKPRPFIVNLLKGRLVRPFFVR